VVHAAVPRLAVAALAAVRVPQVVPDLLHGETVLAVVVRHGPGPAAARQRVADPDLDVAVDRRLHGRERGQPLGLRRGHDEVAAALLARRLHLFIAPRAGRDPQVFWRLADTGPRAGARGHVVARRVAARGVRRVVHAAVPRLAVAALAAVRVPQVVPDLLHGETVLAVVVRHGPGVAATRQLVADPEIDVAVIRRLHGRSRGQPLGFRGRHDEVAASRRAIRLHLVVGALASRDPQVGGVQAARCRGARILGDSSNMGSTG